MYLTLIHTFFKEASVFEQLQIKENPFKTRPSIKCGFTLARDNYTTISGQLHIMYLHCILP